MMATVTRQALTTFRERLEELRAALAVRDVIGVSMLGPSRVGKSTEMAVLLDRLAVLVGAVPGIGVFPDQDTASRLDGIREDIDRIFADPTTRDLPPTEGTEGHQLYNFLLARALDEEGIRFSVNDYAGGWLARTDPELYNKLIAILTHVVAYVIPVDIPALMESKAHCRHESGMVDDACWHCQFNDPVGVVAALDSALKSLSPFERRLVVFVPIRCERHLREGRGPELGDAVISGYPEFFERTMKKGSRRLCVVITPVETLGSVEYAGQRPGSNPARYLPLFEKRTPDAVHEPRNAEAPLIAVLRFVLGYYQELKTRQAVELANRSTVLRRIGLALLRRSRLYWLVDRMGDGSGLRALMHHLAGQDMGSLTVVVAGADMLNFAED